MSSEAMIEKLPKLTEFQCFTMDKIFLLANSTGYNGQLEDGWFLPYSLDHTVRRPTHTCHLLTDKGYLESDYSRFGTLSPVFRLKVNRIEIDDHWVYFDPSLPERAPDWDSQSRLSGGHLHEIPEPHVRMFPDPRGILKRKVEVSITIYSVGIHWSAWIKEDDNPIWNPLTNAEANPNWDEMQNSLYGRQVIGWHRAWDDDEGKGREYHSPRSRSRTLVERWVRASIAKHWPDREGYEFRDHYNDKKDEARWMYWKEGD